MQTRVLGLQAGDNNIQIQNIKMNNLLTAAELQLINNNSRLIHIVLQLAADMGKSWIAPASKVRLASKLMELVEPNVSVTDSLSVVFMGLANRAEAQRYLAPTAEAAAPADDAGQAPAESIIGQVVLKHSLQPNGQWQTIQVRENADIAYAGLDAKNQPCIWTASPIRDDGDYKMHDIAAIIVGTGTPVEKDAEHIGSYTTTNGVYHIFIR